MSLAIKGAGLNPEDIRSFNQIVHEFKDYIPSEVLKGLPQDLSFEIREITNLKKDIRELNCNDTGKIATNIPFKYSSYNKITNKVIFDRSLFQEMVSKSDKRISNCISISTSEFAKRSFIYELSKAYAENQKPVTSAGCWKSFINRFNTGKLTVDGTLSILPPGCSKKVFSNENIFSSKEFFQLTYIPRSTKVFELNSDRVEYFSRELSAYLTQKSYFCERPSLSSLMKDFLGEAKAEIKRLNCKDTNTFYLGQFPFEERTIDKDFVESVDLVHVKARNILKGNDKLYLKFNICKESLKTRKEKKCEVNRFHSYWLGFKEQVEDLLISLKRKGYYARAFAVDDIVMRRELSETLYKDYTIHKLALNRNEINRLAGLMKELIWNNRSQYSFVSPSNLLEFQDILTYAVESLILKDKYFSSITSFVDMLKANKRITKSIPFESSFDEFKYRYEKVRSSLLKSGVTVSKNPLEFLELTFDQQLNMYHDWIQSTRDFASNEGLNVVKRRLEQKQFIQSFTFILDRSMKFKFLQRREELTNFLNKVSVSNIEIDDKFKFYINQSEKRVPFYKDLISFTDYLSKRDENQRDIETLIFDWSQDEKMVKRFPEVKPLFNSGIDLIETQKLLKEKFEVEVAQSVYLYRKSLESYMNDELNKIYRKDYSEVEKAAINAKQLKKIKKELKLHELGDEQVSDMGFRLFVQNFIKKQDAKDPWTLEDQF